MREIAILMLMSVCDMAAAESIYVSQSGAGDGSSCSNSKSISWANSATNWGVGANKVSPGDTVHLCGTFTTGLLPQTSGSPGFPITILFEPGAKFSKDAWGNSAPTADNHTQDPISVGFYASNLIIDGGINGLIECTDNGQGLGMTNNCTAIYLLCADSVEVRNLTITNLWRRTYGSTVDPAVSTAIIMSGAMTNCSIHNCSGGTFGNGFTMNPGAGVSTNCQIYSNTVVDCSWGLAVGQQANSSNYNFKVWNNRINLSSNYTGNPDFHQDGIICYITQNSEKSYGLQISGNYIGPTTSLTNTTAAIFINDTPGTNNFVNPWIFNNVSVLEPPFHWSDGHISASSDTLLIANNTIISYMLPAPNQGYGAGFAITLYGGANGLIYNNLAYQIQAPVYRPYGTIAVSDYNCWNIGNDVNHGFGQPLLGGQVGWSTWTNSGAGYGFDGHSTTNQPALDGNFTPLSTDTVAKGKGFNLSDYFTTDINGNQRGSVWDIGAYQITFPVSVSSLTIGSLQGN